jgi:hypothetical protein
VDKLVQKKVLEIAQMAKRKSGVADTAGRSFYKNWLSVIEDFEQHEFSRKKCEKRDDQRFAKYRRFIGSWKWPN